jgi:uncharacterized protein YecE (DUF72 family)
LVAVGVFCLVRRGGLGLGMGGYVGVVGVILVGTAGWSDKALVAAGWYPRGVHSAEQRLRYYAERFEFVEVNSSFYGLPVERTTRAWVERTPVGFSFNVKAFSLLTHHPTKVAFLPADIRPASGRGSVRQRDVAPDVVEAVWERFVEALDPLAEAGKLGLVLFQFPPWFRPGPEAREYLLECRQRVAPLRMCVEFRDPAWIGQATMDFLAEHQIAYVCVDMPQGLAESVPPVVEVTAKDAVVRFHGRSKVWTTGTKEERYHYLYREQELEEWAERIRLLSARAETTYVVMNNCHGDDAQVNALQLRTVIGKPCD